jgi:hypothetical protein
VIGFNTSGENTVKTRNWKRFALILAQDAFENHFSFRRGVWFCEDIDVLAVYNNNPYANYPELRDEETAKFRTAMEKAGIKVLAYATYPPEGKEDAGYSYAMILDASRDKIDFVDAMMLKFFKESIMVMMS